jgi:hypothetical protein
MDKRDDQVFKRAVVIIMFWAIVDIKSADSSLFALSAAIAGFCVYSLGLGPWYGADIHVLAIICILFTSMCGYTALIAVMVGIFIDQMMNVMAKYFASVLERIERQEREDEAASAATAEKASKE